jgi:CRP-like cAMP-binding protein
MQGHGSPADPQNGNRLLEALRRHAHGAVLRGRPVAPPVGSVLVAAGARAAHVWFPIDGVLSVVVGTAGGAYADSLTVGNEGFAGLSPVLAAPYSLEEVVQQAPGMLVQVPVAELREAADAHPRAARLLDRFTAYSLRFAYQNAVCNAHHSVEQRASRWILSAADRARSTRIRMTQALLADMLGVRRQSVGTVAARLQSAGLIEYSRGEIRIPNRRALERRACECYATTVQTYRRVVEPLL